MYLQKAPDTGVEEGLACSRSRLLPASMAVLATCACVVLAVAIDASSHCRDVGGRTQNIHLADFSVTRLALHPCFPMRTMIPEDRTGNNVDANPRDRLLRLRVFSELLNRWFFLDDRPVTFHTPIRCGKRHAVAGFRVGVTLLTFHIKRQMQFVAERNRLFRG